MYNRIHACYITGVTRKIIEHELLPPPDTRKTYTSARSVPRQPGLYALHMQHGYFYIGAAMDLYKRLCSHFQSARILLSPECPIAAEVLYEFRDGCSAPVLGYLETSVLQVFASDPLCKNTHSRSTGIKGAPVSKVYYVLYPDLDLVEEYQHRCTVAEMSAICGATGVGGLGKQTNHIPAPGIAPGARLALSPEAFALPATRPCAAAAAKAWQKTERGVTSIRSANARQVFEKRFKRYDTDWKYRRRVLDYLIDGYGRKPPQDILNYAAKDLDNYDSVIRPDWASTTPSAPSFGR
jgi:hypothetical protein